MPTQEIRDIYVDSNHIASWKILPCGKIKSDLRKTLPQMDELGIKDY